MGTVLQPVTGATECPLTLISTVVCFRVSLVVMSPFVGGQTNLSPTTESPLSHMNITEHSQGLPEQPAFPFGLLPLHPRLVLEESFTLQWPRREMEGLKYNPPPAKAHSSHTARGHLPRTPAALTKPLPHQPSRNIPDPLNCPQFHKGSCNIEMQNEFCLSSRVPKF